MLSSCFTHALKVSDANGFDVEMEATRFWRYSIYLLYWYKSTNTDAEGAGSTHDMHGLAVHDAQLLENPCGPGVGGAWVCKTQGSADYPAGHGLMPGVALLNITSTLEEDEQQGGVCPPDRALAKECGAARRGTRFTCFTSTTVPILTPEEGGEACKPLCSPGPPASRTRDGCGRNALLPAIFVAL